jgi:hypothetical protein
MIDLYFWILPLIESLCHTFCLQSWFEVCVCGFLGFFVYTCLLSNDPLKLVSAPNSLIRSGSVMH